MEELVEQANARVGSTLNAKWHLDRVLGIGGMASVYAATHRNRKRGAVKVLHRELAARREVRERFLREGYAANRIEHRGVVQVLDDDVAEDGSAYLVMELLEGKLLDDMASSSPGCRLPPTQVTRLMVQLLDVLAAAHEKGVVHRDLKPENLFVTHENELKVLDFGIAQLRDHAGSKITQTGDSMGTPAYMPPEQALGDWERVGPKSDLFAVGATMFTLLTGRTVHEGDTVNKILLSAMTCPPPPIASVLEGLDPNLAAIVDCALSFEPNRRFESAREMRAALDALTSDPADTILERKLASELSATRVATRADSVVALPEAALRELESEVGRLSSNQTLATASRPTEPVQRSKLWIGGAVAALACLAGLGLTAWRWSLTVAPKMPAQMMATAGDNPASGASMMAPQVSPFVSSAAAPGAAPQTATVEPVGPTTTVASGAFTASSSPLRSGSTKAATTTSTPKPPSAQPSSPARGFDGRF